MFIAELKSAAKDAREDLSEDDEIKVLSKERKRRLESIEAFRAGGREDLVAEEEFAAALVQELLPAQLDEAELTTLIDRLITEAGASSPKDMGAVMGLLKKEAGARVDGKTASRIVKERLSG